MSAIVVGYTLNNEGRAALEEAIRQARSRHLHVVVVSSQYGCGQPAGDGRVELQDELARVHARLTEAEVAFTVRPPVEGADPAGDVVAVAEEVDAELVVIGLRRRSPVGKLVLGSHAQRILLEATRPVIAVKAD